MAGTAYTLLFSRSLGERDRMKFYAQIERNFGSSCNGEFIAQDYVFFYRFGEELPGDHFEYAESIAEVDFVPNDSLSVSVGINDAKDLARSLSLEFADLLEADLFVHGQDIISRQ